MRGDHHRERASSPTPAPSPTPTPTPSPGPSGGAPPPPGGAAPCGVRSLAPAARSFCVRRGPTCRRPACDWTSTSPRGRAVSGVLKRRSARFAGRLRTVPAPRRGAARAPSAPRAERLTARRSGRGVCDADDRGPSGRAATTREAVAHGAARAAAVGLRGRGSPAITADGALPGRPAACRTDRARPGRRARARRPRRARPAATSPPTGRVDRRTRGTARRSPRSPPRPARHARAGRAAAGEQRQAAAVAAQLLDDRDPGGVELVRRRRRAPPRDPVGLLDERDAHARSPARPRSR